MCKNDGEIEIFQKLQKTMTLFVSAWEKFNTFVEQILISRANKYPHLSSLIVNST